MTILATFAMVKIQQSAILVWALANGDDIPKVYSKNKLNKIFTESLHSLETELFVANTN
jgi:hypothetical protein